MAYYFYKYIYLFLIGGLTYYNIEILWRGYSHISMIICGGLCFLSIGGLNQFFGSGLSLLQQMAISSIIITTLEFITGLIVNRWLKLNVWDYSDLPLNILGQVCLPYTIAWFFLSLGAIFLDDTLRHFIFQEPWPVYYILTKPI